MTKKQKKKLAAYVITLIIGIIYLIKQNVMEPAKVSDKDGIVDAESCSYVHFLDAGQGDCTLIQTHDGKFALIDASTQSASNRIISYLENAGVEELEFVLFTHPHEDHIGGGDEILNSFKVNTVYLNGKIETTACFERLISAVSQSKKTNGTRVLNPKSDDTFTLSDIRFTVLSDGSRYDDLNDSSICLKMELSDTSFIFTGDAGHDVEKQILYDGFDVDADVLKCGHHGSSSSSSSMFLDEVNPDFAVISCGYNNDYGHPHREIIKELTERGITYGRTDMDGDIVFAFDGNTVELFDSGALSDNARVSSIG